MSLDASCAMQCEAVSNTACLATCWRTETAFIPIGLAIPAAGLLVLLSGLFSGLNLGLLSLDLTGLKVRRPSRASFSPPPQQACHGLPRPRHTTSHACKAPPPSIPAGGGAIER